MRSHIHLHLSSWLFAKESSFAFCVRKCYTPLLAFFKSHLPFITETSLFPRKSSNSFCMISLPFAEENFKLPYITCLLKMYNLLTFVEPCGNISTTNTYQSSSVKEKQKKNHKHSYLSFLFIVQNFGSLYLTFFYLECLKVVVIHTFSFKMIKYEQLSYSKTCHTSSFQFSWLMVLFICIHFSI